MSAVHGLLSSQLGGAPNVVLILIDDAGYGQFGTFGGQTPTPDLDRLFLGRTVSRASSKQTLPSGKVTLRGDFKYDGGGMGKGGTLSLFVNDAKVGEGRLNQTQGITLGLGGTLDVGEDTGSPVDEAYTPPFRFNGTIRA